MKGLMRSLRDASVRAARVTGLTLLLILGMTLYFIFLNGEPFAAEHITARLPVTIIFVGNLMLLLYGMADVVSHMQMSLACGATRKHTLIGMIYMNLLQVLVLCALLAVLYALVPAGRLHLNGAVVCRLAMNLFLLAGGLSFVSGLFIYRFGRVAYLILTILTSMSGGVFVSVANFYFGRLQAIGAVEMWMNTLVGGCAGILAFAVCAVIFWFGIRKIEVRI